MNRLPIAIALGLALLAFGCRSGGNQELLERELRWQEDRIRHLESHICECEQQLEACQQENDALEAREHQPRRDDSTPAPAEAGCSKIPAAPAARQLARPESARCAIAGAASCPRSNSPTEQAPPFQGPPLISPPNPSVPEGEMPSRTSRVRRPDPELRSPPRDLLPKNELPPPPSGPSAVGTSTDLLGRRWRSRPRDGNHAESETNQRLQRRRSARRRRRQRDRRTTRCQRHATARFRQAFDRRSRSPARPATCLHACASLELHGRRRGHASSIRAWTHSLPTCGWPRKAAEESGI